MPKKQAVATQADPVRESSTSLPKKARPVRIKRKSFELLIKTLHEAIQGGRGLYKTVTMNTHAPQVKFYPGCEALIKVPSNLNQVSFFREDNLDEWKVVRPNVIWLPHTLEHAIWLWFAVHEDLQDVSDQVYPRQCKLANDHPELYTVKILSMSAEEVAAIFSKREPPSELEMRKYRLEMKALTDAGLDASMLKPPTGKGLYKVAEALKTAKQWKACAKTLFEEFEGDPIVLLKKTGWSVAKLHDWKMKRKRMNNGEDPLPGWGVKLISLYFLYVAELGYGPLPVDAFPVDLHAQALPQQLGLIDWGDSDYIYSAPFAEMLRKEYCRVCKKNGYNVVDVAHASWLLGSSLCNGCSGNSMVPSLCPVYKECRGRIDTGSYTLGKWYSSNKFHSKSGESPRFGLPQEVAPRIYRPRKTAAKAETPKHTTIPLFEVKT